MKKLSLIISSVFIISFLIYSCDKDTHSTGSNLPVLSTKEVTDTTATSAVCGGEIISDGGLSVNSRGLCWSTLENPTIEDSITVEGSGTGSFTSEITGLDPNTAYYVRAYAINSEGTSYGNTKQFTTLDDEAVEIFISGDVSINLGEDFDPLSGVTVTGASIEDVEWSAVPEFDKHKVNEYEFTYSVGNASANRTIWVKSDLLDGYYNVVDDIDGSTIEYEVTVTQKSGEFNVLLINGFSDFNIVVYVIVNGDNITIPQQTPTGWLEDEYIEGTGTYNGQTKSLESFTYQVTYFYNNQEIVENCYAVYSRTDKKTDSQPRLNRRIEKIKR